MTISITHPYVSTDPNSGNTTLVQPSDWNNSHTLTLANGKLLGRVTVGSGAFEEITLGASLSISAGVLNCSISLTPAATVDYQLFTANGTWTKPSGVTFVFVRCVGGGGGAAGGSVASTNRLGGNGGNGGIVSEYLFLASSIGATAGVVCGSGGAGGSGQVYGGAAAGNGSDGGTSSFNNAGSAFARLYAVGGSGNFQNSVYPWIYTVNHGRNPVGNRLVCSGHHNTTAADRHGFNGPFGPAGGGIGGANNVSASVSAGYGGAGFANYVGAPTVSGQVGSSSFGTNTAGTTSDGTAGVNATVKGYGGSGGQGKNYGNYSSTPYSGGAGGNGYLGGGGGGGGSYGWVTTPPSGTLTGGAGGAGGSGFVEIFSW